HTFDTPKRSRLSRIASARTFSTIPARYLGWRIARLNQNQARSATDCSRPCRSDGLINRGLPRKFRVACRWQGTRGTLLMAQGACLMLAPTRSGSHWAVPLGGWEQPRIKRPRKGIGWFGTVESLPATLPRGRNESPRCEKGQPELVVPTGLAMS